VIDIATNTVTTTIDLAAASFRFRVAFGPCAAPDPTLEAEVAGNGRTVSMTGSGFPADTTVTVSLDDITLGTASLDDTGAFAAEFTVDDCDLTGGTLGATAGDTTVNADVTTSAEPTSTVPDPTTTTPDLTTATHGGPASSASLPASGATEDTLLCGIRIPTETAW